MTDNGVMEERIFQIQHRLVATESFKVKIPFEEVMLMFFQASKELHWSVAKHEVFRGEFIFASPRSYRCGGEVIYVKVQMDGEDEEGNEICQVQMMSRPRRATTFFDFKKNLYNITKLTEFFEEVRYEEEIEIEDSQTNN